MHVTTLLHDMGPGGTPGRVAEVDADLKLVAEHPRSNRSINEFNPHGGWVGGL
jgi:hypothetical protein